MSFTIKYCEKCGERVDEEDLTSGRAIHFKNESYCVNCKQEVLPALQADPEFARYEAQLRRRDSDASKRPSSVLDLQAGRRRSASGRRQSQVLKGAGRKSTTTKIADVSASSTRRRSSPATRPIPKHRSLPVPILISVATGVMILVVCIILAVKGNRQPEIAGGGMAEAAAQPASGKTPEDTTFATHTKVKEDAFAERQKRLKRILDEAVIFAAKKVQDEDYAAALVNWRRTVHALKGSSFWKRARDLLDTVQREYDRKAETYFDEQRRRAEQALKGHPPDFDQAHRHLDLLDRKWIAPHVQPRLLRLKRRIEEERRDYERKRRERPRDGGSGQGLPAGTPRPPQVDRTWTNVATSDLKHFEGRPAGAIKLSNGVLAAENAGEFSVVYTGQKLDNFEAVVILGFERTGTFVTICAKHLDGKGHAQEMRLSFSRTGQRGQLAVVLRGVGGRLDFWWGGGRSLTNHRQWVLGSEQGNFLMKFAGGTSVRIVRFYLRRLDARGNPAR